mgnify:FL=1
MIPVILASLTGRELNPENDDGFTSLGRANRPEKAFLIHQTNNMWSAVTNFGSVGDPNSPSTGRPSVQWPAGSGNNYLYDGGFWVGTLIAGEAAVTTYFYSPDQEHLPSSGAPGEIGNFVNGEKSKSLEDSYVVYDDIDEHTESEHVSLGIKVIQRGLTWSLPEFDDFIAFEYSVINTGTHGNLEDVYLSYWYDIDISSSDADAPHIDDLVDYDGWDGQDTETDISDIVDPLDLDGNGLTGYDEWGVPWGKDEPQNPNYDASQTESDGFYDEWALILDPDGEQLHWQTNGGGGNPGDLAIITDPVSGEPDTLVGWLFPRSMSYIYDGDNSTSSANDYGERENPSPNNGFLAGAILYTDAEPNVFEDGSSHMGAFSHQWWNWESDPGTDEERYQFMTGTHTSSLGRRYLDNPLDLGFPEFDYRFLLTVGPVDIAEGDTTKIVFVLGIGNGLEGVRKNIDNAYIAYYSGNDTNNPLNPSSFDDGVHWNLPIPPLAPTLNYSPLPSGMRAAWDNLSENSWDANLGRVDFEGYQLYRAIYNPQDWEMIAAFDNIDEPVLIVNSFGDTLNEWDTNSESWILIDLPDIKNQCDDSYQSSDSDRCYSAGGSTAWGSHITSPVDGLPYYYAIASYDGYKSAEEAGQELLPAYSPLTNYKKSFDGAPVPVLPGKLYEDGDAIASLSGITVVPNPYLGTAYWEVEYEDKIEFKNLPPVCKISIFSLAGDLIQEIQHDNATDYEFWNLVTKNQQSIVSGVYIYVVEAPKVSETGLTSGDLKKHIGKFVVFR